MRLSIDLKALAEIAFVFAVLLSVKAIADALELTGAGGIAMWSAIIAATLMMKRRRGNWRSLGVQCPSGGKEWLQTIGLALLAVVSVIVFMALILDPLVTYFELETPEDATDRFAFLLGQPLYFAAYLVGVVWIGAAIGEELFMRGFVLNRLVDVLGQSTFAWGIALVVHAVIFGLLHIYQGVPGMIGTGCVALIFGGIYLLGKRKLLPVIVGHGVINTISLTAYYLSDGAIK